ncbi:Bug family tripartite tricarboxylate transporter substrate binding protein [Roseinatronobacter alkalisoli]|uniref:Tripartite tricarboxylate transporter substrate binding protein n=1 Tax=Roseinatronobacter alkalisoli TaxID=3028235 RepID=A0ABT5TB62_9RHOB|nr:tripartite tricarboxylate transporter substrate binding protein [Roseinatronobacter sp. HJB301]MDD7972360.1 tripartite tricarboxylate transporter substrate binding protein [Roseinatronobacter sp. HJB301]
MLRIFLCSSALLVANAAGADTLRIVVPFSPGGAQDTLARWYAQHIDERTEYSVIVDNRPGAGGSLAADEVAQADPDGWTILQASGGAITIAPHLRDLPYDPQSDFAPVALFADTPMTLAVRADSAFESIEDVIAAAEADPGGVAYASTGHTSVSHLTGALLAQAAGIDLMHVPYQGAAPGLADLLGGIVPLMVTSAASIDQMVESGDARVLAVFSPVSLSNLEGVPTIEDALDAENLNSPVWAGYLAPAGTPQERIDELSQLIVDICEMPETQERYLSLGATLVCGDADALAAVMDEDYTRWGAVIEAAGIEAE